MIKSSVVNRLLQLAFIGTSLLHAIFAAAQTNQAPTSGAATVERPNIVWIVGDDLGIQIAPYGHTTAITPTLSRLASVGTLFANSYAVSPTCSPSRSALITGRYPTEVGTHHHRSRLAVAPKTMLELLANSGYRIGWPKIPDEGKTDFNFDSPRLTQATSNWPHEVPSEPFFAYVNDMVVHEGKLKLDEAGHRRLTADLTSDQRQDPGKISVPPYYPDTPEVRRSLARYEELVTAFDHRLKRLLDTLHKAGVLERTIIMVFGDNGPGFPRAKRLLYDDGTRVPLIMAGPGIDGSAVRNDLVSLLDLAPTTLALAGVKPPSSMSGRVIAGPGAGPAPGHVISVRDRTEDVPMRMRSVRDGKFLYIRNFTPEIAYSTVTDYAKETPVWKVLMERHGKGLLSPLQTTIYFQSPRPSEELYDVSVDPHQIRNLAANSEFEHVLHRLRTQLADWMRKHEDLGGVPESELIRSGFLIGPSRLTIVPFGSR
jgi:uncharacterized sulfatase